MGRTAVYYVSMAKILRMPALQALGAGLLSFLAMTVPAAWPAAIAGVALFILSARRAESNREAAVLGLAFGALASAGGVWWFWDTIPLTWIAVPEGPAQFFLVAVVWSLTVLSLALPFSIAAPLMRAVPARWFAPLLLGASYALAEELRLWSFALFFLGPESQLAPDFSIAGLGYALMESPLLAPLGQAGSAGLNVWIAVAGATAAAVALRERWAKTGAALLCIALLASYLALPQPSSSATLRIALLSTNTPPGPFSNPAPVLSLLTGASTQHADIIVIPEGLGLAPFIPEAGRQELYQNLFGGRQGLVISSSVVKEGNDERAELTYESPEDGVIATQDKMFFVPVGEYLPPLLRLATSLAGKENLHGYGDYIEGRIVRGTSLSSASLDGFRIGALLCSEMLSPRLYRDLAREHETDLLVNVANNSWFHGSQLLHARLKQLAKTHALQNRQPMLVAANGSPAYAVDARGRLLAEAAWGQDEVLIVEIAR